MKVVETTTPPAPAPPRTFNLEGLTETELRLIGELLGNVGRDEARYLAGGEVDDYRMFASIDITLDGSISTSDKSVRIERD